MSHPVAVGASRPVVIASYLLMGLGLLGILLSHLLVGLLCACVGFLFTRWFTRLTVQLAHRRLPPRALARVESIIKAVAILLVVLGPLALLALGVSQAREYVVEAPQQYRGLLDYVARTILELRQKLPPELAASLPAAADDVQRMVANYLRNEAGTLALAGRAWLNAVLHGYVGLIVGGLAAVALPPLQRRPLAAALHQRITTFGLAFKQIVAAQFWIASFNTALTATFLLLVLPLWDTRLPYTPVLITFTFVAGLVPIVGNLLCNVVLTLVGLSVSPVTAAACLVFLILIHKAEYVINAKVVGKRTHMAVWELLSVMFVAETVFGPAGLVAAPLFYAYLKKELEAAKLV
ncbi:AI-2E family transporter [Pseudacidovorax sp. RU35E]|uniref:AI-2E family transporter n=1 Tax=Pseudacidovorax sp. RU35E TaxID=1907403 RepID=UPI0009568AC4|nr:AI-2E family transporter [Pseudacidovorax sp. RU35E]SIQ84011.1 Predicted PurR-regulated permease PerM [Pseudacidovorax sp. RU35E]